MTKQNHFVKLTRGEVEIYVPANKIEHIRRGKQSTAVYTLSGRRFDVSETPERIIEEIM